MGMQLIGQRYETKRKLGSGALGDVFLVRDRRDDNDICLKLLRIEGSGYIQSLKDEFLILSQLNHPNLIRVYDFGIDENLGPYFTMEYAPGGTSAVSSQ